MLSEGLAVANRVTFEFSYGYFLPWKDAMVASLREQQADVFCFAARSNLAILATARRVARHLRARQIDLVHAHLPMAGIVARIAGRLAGVPVVYTEHNLQERYHSVTRLLNRWTWGWQSEAIAVSAEVAESIRRNMGSGTPVRTVLNGVNVVAFERGNFDGSQVRSELGISAEAPVVGAIAVFRKQKRLEDWLKVARRTADRVPGVQFLLVGDGPERKHVEATIRELELDKVVHLAGLQEEVRPFLAAMDVYLMTSEFEGLPIALLEAMSMETAPVVTAVGGIPELIRRGENGCLQEFGDVDALADDVVTLLEDTDQRKRIARTARETVVENFSMERMQRDLEAIYERVIASYRDEALESDT